MHVSKIRIQNFRLLVDTEVDIDPKTTLIVGRNNTEKTSFFALSNIIRTIITLII